MGWQFITALILVIPVILFPVALIWYLNIGGTYAAMKEWRLKWAARRAMKRLAQPVNAAATKEPTTDKESCES